jgi:hypothetical protein
MTDRADDELARFAERCGPGCLDVEVVVYGALRPSTPPDEKQLAKKLEALRLIGRSDEERRTRLEARGISASPERRTKLEALRALAARVAPIGVWRAVFVLHAVAVETEQPTARARRYLRRR